MNKIIKNSGKILISGLLIFSLVGCGKVPVLKNGEEAVVTSDAKNISVTEFYEKIKEKYGVNVLVDMIDEMILSDKYKETTKEEKEYIIIIQSILSSLIFIILITICLEIYHRYSIFMSNLFFPGIKHDQS